MAWLSLVLAMGWLALSVSFLHSPSTASKARLTPAWQRHLRLRDKLRTDNTDLRLPLGGSLNWKRMGDVKPLKGPFVQPKRRKTGPATSRRHGTPSENVRAGRVSVYCIGAGIDLEALRAHVFRRGFSPKDEAKPDLILARDASDLDDKVLHVTNAPVFIRPSKNGDISISRGGGISASGGGSEECSSSLEDATDGTEESSALSWQAKEMLVMSTQDIFYFDFGCVALWGLSAVEEKAALKELEPFIIEPVTPEALENSFDTMQYVFDESASSQKPIRFDRIKVRSTQTEEKLAISYAMAQSSKLFVFEQRILENVERTRFLPRELATSGRIKTSKKELNRLIGQLFVEQTEVNLFSSILDSPDFLWDDDEYFPVYEYTRSYLEVDDRVGLLNRRLAVIRDLLDVLTTQLASANSTRLEWLVIWLVAVEIVMGIAASPLSGAQRALAALFVPSAILLYKKLDWTAES